ncbi:MAG TPA: hypothetical protein VJU87_04180 [Gemmatimonadaceae bacterium]|nr:hypothetical protein [Gemmatimonadaceae bacterium]
MPTLPSPRALALSLAAVLLLACSNGPITKQLGDYSTLHPSFTIPPNEKSPTRATVALDDPAYVTMLYVVPGRGASLVYPSDSTVYNHLDAGKHDVPLRFGARPYNRDSMIAVLRRSGEGGRRNIPQGRQRDTIERDTSRLRGAISEPSVASSPVGYLLLIASPQAIAYTNLHRRVEGVTIPIEDDEALSTVMKLVKATLPDGTHVAGYAKEVERG